ncbi:hypothetical protein BH09PLA1_BH09PLA1_10160 [soil metagenome]
MRTEQILRAGMVGAGQICAYHVAALRRISHVEIVGLHDVDAARAERASAELKIPALPSLDALRHAGANVIHVLTPPHTHANLTMLALDLGCHVYVEKSAAMDFADCLSMANFAAARKLQVCVGHSLLFDPQVKRALETVRSGKMGRVVSVDFLRSSMYPPYEGGALPPQCRSAGYPFRDLGVHALYLFEAFLGPIEHVQADWKSLGGAPNLAFDEWRAQVRCRDGIGQCQLSWNVRPMQSQLIIQGTKGVLRVDLFLMFQSKRMSTRLPKPAERMINAWTDSTRPLVQMPLNVLGVLTGRILPYQGLQSLVAEFYQSLRDGGSAPVTVADAKRIVQWTERVARLADQDHHRRLTHHRLTDSVPFLVTGASGALGRAIVARLQDEGKRVRVFVRRPPESSIEGVEVAVGDLGDADAVNRAVRGAEVVIHAGAAMRGSWSEFSCATVKGTQNVVDACLANGVERLVHVSSLSVLDWCRAHRADALRESSRLEPHPTARGNYTRSKLEAEEIVTHAAFEQRLRAVILRPGQIFGGSIPLLTPAVARRAGKRWIVLGNGRQNLPLIHMDDVVEAIMRAAASDLKHGEIIHLVDDVTPTQNEVLEAVLGADARIVHIPRPLVIGAGAMLTAALKLLGRASPVSPYRLRSAMSLCSFASDQRALLDGWRPTVGLRGGIDRDVSTSPGRVAHPVPADDLLISQALPSLGNATSSDPRA